MASRFASVTSEEITQINDGAVPENTKKVTKFGLDEFEDNGLSFSHGVYRSKPMRKVLFTDANEPCVTSLVHLKIKVE